MRKLVWKKSHVETSWERSTVCGDVREVFYSVLLAFSLLTGLIISHLLGETITHSYTTIRAVSAPPGTTTVQGTPTGGPGTGSEKKTSPKLQKQRSFTVTTVYTPPSNRSKALQKIRAKTRAAKAFKTSLSVGGFTCLSVCLAGWLAGWLAGCLGYHRVVT